MLGLILVILLLLMSRVPSRLRKGKFSSLTISLSERSTVSNWSCERTNAKKPTSYPHPDEPLLKATRTCIAAIGHGMRRYIMTIKQKKKVPQVTQIPNLTIREKVKGKKEAKFAHLGSTQILNHWYLVA